MDIRELLGKRILFFDGAMGTMFQEMGLKPGEMPETLNHTRPELVEKVHRMYLSVGADIISTNTFGANRYKLENTGYGVFETVSKAVSIARQAADAYSSDKPRFVAMDLGPTGKLLEPLGTLGFEQAYDAFKEAAISGEQSGADFVLIETMSDTYEVKAAVLAIKENTRLPVFVMMTFDIHGKLLTGADIPAMVALLEGLGVDGLGMNCGLGPKQVQALFPELKVCASVPIILNPNAGLPRSVNGRTVYDITSEEFALTMKELVESGAWMVGGCCGTTPEHIQKLVQACKDIKPVPLTEKGLTVISSYSKAVQFGQTPVIIGERINPTGKKRFKEALRQNDMDYILDEAVKQQDAGAQILDVNVGLPEIDEGRIMVSAVRGIQGIVNLPLQIDTADAGVMERALRLYNGKALVNSVNGKQQVMDAIFPLVRKYGGVVIGLTLDEEGIPDSAEGRFKIAKKIVDTAAVHGIQPKDIIIDPLALTVSSDPQAAKTTLEAMKLIKERLGVKTSLGVSNVSFGLPQREVINAAFFMLALQNGLDAGIINPCSDVMMNAYRTYNLLSGKDPDCAAYIAAVSEKPAVQSNQEALSLEKAIVKGLRDRAFSLAEEQLKSLQPLDIINSQIVPALDVVGREYENGSLFLPQLLMSAQVAKSAFEAVSAYMQKTGMEQQKKEKIILATVKGDIHDIGKNIVKAMLENYGFDVLDLGKDVPPENIVLAASQSGAKLVGLSALMTTTVRSMEETISRIKAGGLSCKIMVGGAVLTQEYADMIGADHYAKDAMGAVYYAQQLLK